jgi:hypothetical protein
MSSRVAETKRMLQRDAVAAAPSLATREDPDGCADRGKSARGAADWIRLAAAPTFAAMALLTALLGGDGPVALCMAQHASPLSGMVPMYLLMSVFHLVPWLNLASGRRTSAS